LTKKRFSALIKTEEIPKVIFKGRRREKHPDDHHHAHLTQAICSHWTFQVLSILIIVLHALIVIIGQSIHE